MDFILKVAVAFRKEKLETEISSGCYLFLGLSVDGEKVHERVRDPQSQREVKTDRNEASTSLFGLCLQNAWSSAGLDLPSGFLKSLPGRQGECVHPSVLDTFKPSSKGFLLQPSNWVLIFKKAFQEKIAPTIKHAPCAPDHSSSDSVNICAHCLAMNKH